MSRRRTGRDTDQTRVMDQTPPSMGDARLHAEAETWVAQRHAELLAAGTPASKRYLRAQLVKQWDREELAVRITYLRTNGEVARSVPVDSTVGERVSRRLAG